MAFNARSTTDEVLQGVDLTGKRVFIIGVSAGLGVETARALATHGATVVGAARNLKKAREALDGALGASAPIPELMELDLASLASFLRGIFDYLHSRKARSSLGGSMTSRRAH